MASEDLFRSDTDDTGDPTPDEIEIDGWTYTPSTITSVHEDKKEFDRLTGILVQTFGELIGSNDILEAEYNFIKYCRKYVKTSENHMQELRQYVRNKSSATASTTTPASPRASTSASASSSASSQQL